jgi:hypothetical protein
MGNIIPQPGKIIVSYCNNNESGREYFGKLARALDGKRIFYRGPEFVVKRNGCKQRCEGCQFARAKISSIDVIGPDGQTISLNDERYMVEVGRRIEYFKRNPIIKLCIPSRHMSKGNRKLVRKC